MRNFNFSPYNDDFQPEKKFYRILAVPGRAHQAREFTQSQSILQNQISNFADHIFKNGSMVIPGHISYDLSYFYVKLESTLNGQPIDLSTIDPELNSEPIIITGSISGIRARVLKIIRSEFGDPDTLFVKYLNSGNSGQEKTFFSGDVTASPAIFAEFIRKEGTGINIAKIQNSNFSPVGSGSAAIIDNGVYYVDGFFVSVDRQTIILDKYSATPSYRIGLKKQEEIVTSFEDESLLENAQGVPSFGANGADRYKISLILEKREINESNNDDFVELLRLVNGKRQKQVEDTEYSLIEEALARRTFEKSGNFYLQPFKIDVREHLNTGNNRGVYLDSEGGSESKLAIGLEPSKAYVEGFEIKTIATQFIDVDKGRDSVEINNSSLRSNLGSWIYVTQPYNIPQISGFQTIGLYSVEATTDISGNPTGNDPGSNNLIGQANIREFELVSSNVTSSNALYRAYIFNVRFFGDNTISNVRSYYRAGFPPIAGTVCHENILIGPPVGAFTVGDNIQNTSGTQRERIVAWFPQTSTVITKSITTFPRIATNNIINYANDSGTPIVENAAKLIEKIIIQDTNTVAPIFKLRDSSIKTLRNSSNQYDIVYTAKRQFTTTVTDNSSPLGAGKIIINLGNFEEFGSFSVKDYVASVLDGSLSGTLVNFAAGSGVSVNIIPGGSLEISGLPSGIHGSTVRLICPVIKTNPTPKSKLLVTETITIGYIVNQPIQLNRCDIFKIESILMNGTEDITERFWLDNGQRDTFYGRGKIYLKNGAPIPTNNSLTITYSFFEHSSGGDFFCVDSYNLVQVGYPQLPIYYSQDTDETYVLADCLDFRPKTNDNNDDFPIGGNSEVTQNDSNIVLDYQFYVGRIDKIFLDRFGNFKVIRGVSSRKPIAPEDPKSGMLLYVLTIPPYTYSPSQVGIKMIDNRRFTERDIGKIADRVSNLEYYTTLTLKEQQTSSLEILDASTGLPRYKNGFIVDNFSGHGVGDATNNIYRCSIDGRNSRMRSEFVQNNINLLLQETDPDTSNTPVSRDYAKTGKLITLPYSEVNSVNQPFASKRVNINPYNIFNFIGKVSLDPSSDTWRDTNRLPDIITEDNTLFDAERQRLQSLGVLGTVWNEWTTNWTGTPQTTQETVESIEIPRTIQRNILIPVSDFVPGFNNTEIDGQRFIVNTIFDTVNQRESVVRTTTNTAQGQTRTGLSTNVVPGRITQTSDDRLVDSSVIPFMRSRDVFFETSRMKPNTLLYSYFDNVNITDFVCASSGSNYSAAPIVTLSGGGGTGAVVQAIVNNGKIVYYNVINGGSGYVSAPTITLSNVNGAIAADVSDIVIKISNGVITNIFKPLKTNARGKAEGLFRIPNNSNISFRTGNRIFRLTDSSVNNPQNTTSWAEATYSASGILETRQNNIISTREPEIVRTTLTESRVVTNTVQNSQTISDATDDVVNWIDPLAQTFLITDRGGAFLTSVEIYFSSKDENIPVTLQIRNTVNGYPGQQILPFAEVTLEPEQVAIDPSGIGNVSTKFTFSSPVYIRENVEYSIVLLSNCDSYNVYVAKVGETDIATDELITTSPYAGVFFMSQNASTWTAEQTEDLKMKINRASFDISKTGQVVFVNDVTTTKNLSALSLQTKSGSNIVRIFDRNHGFVRGSVGSRVQISNVTGTTLNGIPVSEINGTKEVFDVTLDSYTIRTITNATESGLVGNENISVSRDIQYNLCHPIVQTLVLPETNINSTIITTTGKSVSGSETPYRKNLTPRSIVLNSDLEFNTPRTIASPFNEINMIQNGSGVFNNKSLVLNNFLTSNLENLSPVIDLDRVSMILISNRIADYSHQTVNISGFDLFTKYTLTNNSFIVSTDSTINTTVDMFTDYSLIGKYINITGANLSVGNVVNTFNGAVLVTDIISPRKLKISGKVLSNQGSSGSPITGDVIISVYENYVDDISPNNSSSPAIYITKPFTLKNPADSIKVFLTANITSENNFDVYYKVGTEANNRLFQNNVWIKLPLISNPINNLGFFREYEFGVDGLVPYNVISYKIVMRSKNSSAIPQFDDFRGISIT